MTKLQRLIGNKNSYPTNGFTFKNYKNSNYKTLNESCKKNGYEYNIWFSENQCIKSGLQLIDNKPTYTMDRRGYTFKVYNISQTDYKLPMKKQPKKNSVSKPQTQKQPIQMFQSNDLRVKMLEKMVINLYDKLGYSMSDVDLENLLNVEVELPTSPIQPTVTPKKIINQTELGRILNLPQKVIKYLKDENIIGWKRDGKQTLFDETSVIEFQKTFNRDDYLSERECSSKLNRWEFTSFRDGRKNVYFNPLHIYINTTTLINGSGDIPSEYQLEYVEFGDTKFIRRTSFSKTLNWLRNINNRLHPKLTQHQKDELDKLFGEKLKEKKEKVKNHNIGKKIKNTPIQMNNRYGSHHHKLGVA